MATDAPQPEDRPLSTPAMRLRAARKSRGWSYAKTADRLARHVPDQCPDRDTLISYIKRWEAGKVTRISDRYQYALAATFDTTEEALFAPIAPPTSDPPPGPTGTVERSPTTGSWDDDVKRRELIGNSAAVGVNAALAPVLAALSSSWQKSQPRLPGASVSQAVIDDWEDAYPIHVRRYVNAAPSITLTGLTRDWVEIAPHLPRRQPEGVKRDIAHAAAKHAGLIAATTVQLGDERLARRWWLTARNLADQSGDRHLSAYARSWEATNRVVNVSEHLPELARLAREARELAGSKPTGTLVYATLTEAEVLASMGNHSAAVSAIRHAEEVFSRIPSSQSDRKKNLHLAQSLVYSLAGSTKNAAEARQAAQHLHNPATHFYSSIQLKLHEIVLHTSTDPSNALKEAVTILGELPQERRIARVRVNARRVINALPEPARTLPAAQDLSTLIST
ncbi:helix-turn-helix domain-containing protein [Actinomadura roseirufa]|uniref:helix-turn-helix domain-containing protein n=1 Tax=Actinomadura roseirufa TaxID=2094049 RepID=UPI0010416E19|nr:helix-turn-helix domain-containing protein [Actinomadura roseirufa]